MLGKPLWLCEIPHTLLTALTSPSEKTCQIKRFKCHYSPRSLPAPQRSEKPTEFPSTEFQKTNMYDFPKSAGS